MIRKLSVVLALLALIAPSAFAEDQVRNNYVPTTISPEAQQALRAIYGAEAYNRVFPAADDLEGWRKAHADGEKGKVDAGEKAAAAAGVSITATTMGGVPVLDLRPSGWQDNGKVLVYTHGGAYTMFSARSTLISSAPMSHATGLRVISVDYTTAPFARWDEIQEQVVSVFKGLLEQGYRMEDIALYGDSAGGGLAISTVLNLRDRGMGMPAAVALLSPWADLSYTGDSMHTLESTDPSLHYDPLLKNSAEAFADGLDLKDPRVSPLYGDFIKGFSPALITEGTKCIFLSTSVRMYQALEAAGQEAKLDVYEGMWHVFQVNPLPETDVSLGKIAAFLHHHLRVTKFPERTTFVLPPVMKESGKILEDAGIDIVYGSNPVPPPEGISAEAKAVWRQLPQLPLQGHDPDKLAALRRFSAIGEQAAYEKFSRQYAIEDRVINGITTQWTTPKDLKHKDKVMIFIHGGGMVVNTRKTQMPLQVGVANSLGVKVVSIEYPLAPEHPYPAAVHDIVKAYQGIIAEYGAENVGLFGTSAGGGLTAATLLRLKADGLPLPAASAPLSPEADMTASGYLFAAVGLNDPILPPYGTYTAVRSYARGSDPTDPLVSPVFGDWTGMTPMFLLCGTSEVLASDAIRIAANARTQGVDVTLYVSDGMWHVPIGDGTGVPELQQAYDEMIRFFERHLRVGK